MAENQALNKISSEKVQYAGFWRRFLAYFIDSFIMFILSLTLQRCFGRDPFIAFKVKSLEELQQMQTSAYGTITTLIGLAFGLVYSLIFWVNYEGATPGKRLLAIKITKDDGAKITYAVSFIRWLSNFISAFALGLGYLWVLWDKRKQAWHDKIAKTVVIKTGEKPRTFLVIVLSLISILFSLVYISASLYKGFMLSWQGGGEKREVKQALRKMGTRESWIEEMSPEIKVHWQRSQELFQQMKENANDPEKVRQLNDENIKELKAILELEPDNHQVWAELGAAYTWVSSEGTLEDCLAAYKKAEELESNNVIYINNVGDMLIRMERYEEAVLQFQKTLRLTDRSGYANFSLGTTYKALGIYDSAREHFQKAIEIFEGENKEGKYDDEILRAKKEISSLPQ